MVNYYYVPEVDADCRTPNINLNRHDCGLFITTIMSEEGKEKIVSARCRNTAGRYFEQSITDEELLRRIHAETEPISLEEFQQCREIYL